MNFTGFLQPKLICICLLKRNINLLCERHRSRRKKVSRFFHIFFVQTFYIEQVKSISVPQIKGLRVEDLDYFIETKVDNGIDYLSQIYKETTLNRKWIVNLCTLLILLLWAILLIKKTLSF